MFIMYTLCPVVQPLKTGAASGLPHQAKIIGCLARAARVKMELISPLAEEA